MSDSTTVKEIMDVMARLIRNNLFGGRELVLIEPANGPRPAEPFASLHFLSAREEPHEVYETVERDGELFQALRGEHYCRMRISFFGEGADQRAIDCRNLLRSTAGPTAALDRLIGYGGIGEVQEDNTRYLGVQEDRAFFNLEFYANLGAEYPVEPIKNVYGEINGDGFLVDSCPQADAGQ